MTPEDKSLICGRMNGALKELTKTADDLQKCINKAYGTAPNYLPDGLLEDISKISFAVFDVHSGTALLKTKLKTED